MLAHQSADSHTKLIIKVFVDAKAVALYVLLSNATVVDFVSHYLGVDKIKY